MVIYKSVHSAHYEHDLPKYMMSKVDTKDSFPLKKVQTSTIHEVSPSRTQRTQIPKLIATEMGLEPGDELEWSVDTEDIEVGGRKEKRKIAIVRKTRRL